MTIARRRIHHFERRQWLMVEDSASCRFGVRPARNWTALCKGDGVGCVIDLAKELVAGRADRLGTCRSRGRSGQEAWAERPVRGVPYTTLAHLSPAECRVVVKAEHLADRPNPRIVVHLAAHRHLLGPDPALRAPLLRTVRNGEHDQSGSRSILFSNRTSRVTSSCHRPATALLLRLCVDPLRCPLGKRVTMPGLLAPPETLPDSSSSSFGARVTVSVRLRQGRHGLRPPFRRSLRAGSRAIAGVVSPADLGHLLYPASNVDTPRSSRSDRGSAVGREVCRL